MALNPNQRQIPHVPQGLAVNGMGRALRAWMKRRVRARDIDTRPPPEIRPDACAGTDPYDVYYRAFGPRRYR